MPSRFTAPCECCELQHLFTDHQDGESRPTERVCSTCSVHRGDSDSQVLLRSQHHEVIYRERFLAASAGAKTAEARRDDYHDRLDHAIWGRDRAIALLQQLDDLHVARSDGSCACGVELNCSSAALLSAGWAESLTRRVDQPVERVSEEQAYRLAGMYPRDNGWEDDVATPPQTQPRKSDTA